MPGAPAAPGLLSEVAPARQRPHEPRRRWFSSEHLDLIVWLDDADHPTGFQLCYGKPRAEHALTWTSAEGFAHAEIDDGQDVGLGYKKSPVLVSDGALDVAGLERVFCAASVHVPPDLAAFVVTRLRAHPAYAGG
jgi:hypothetical protein